MDILALSAGVENTLSFSTDVTKIEVENKGYADAYVLLDQTVAVDSDYTYTISAGATEIIYCQGCSVLHAIASSATTLIVTTISTLTRRYRGYLVAATETIIDFNDVAGEFEIYNSGNDDIYVALDETATVSGSNTMLVPGSSIGSCNIPCRALHVISAGTPLIMVTAADYTHQNFSKGIFKVREMANMSSSTPGYVTLATGLTYVSSSVGDVVGLIAMPKSDTDTIYTGLTATVAEADAYIIDMNDHNALEVEIITNSGTGSCVYAFYTHSESTGTFSEMYKEDNATGTTFTAVTIAHGTTSASYSISNIRGRYLKIVPTVTGTIDMDVKVTRTVI